jgi:hypothetical protein
MAEAFMTINDKPLTAAQSMTVRVALSTFAMDLHGQGLGDDEHGSTMTEGYLKAIREIYRMMYPAENGEGR